MKISSTLLILLSLFCGLIVSQYGQANPNRSHLGESEVIIYPYGLMDSVRNTNLSVPMQVQLYNAGKNAIQLEKLVVTTPERQDLSVVPLDSAELIGDDGFVLDLYYDLESIEPDISHRHTKRQYIPLENYEPLGPEGEAMTIRRVVDNVRQLQESGAPQLLNVRFELDLHQLFGPNSEPGDVAPLIIIAYWHDGAKMNSTLIEHHISKLNSFMPPPEQGRMMGSGGTWVAGDLHVHNCRDEAIGGCDSCAAESFNITGAFTNADLKTQFQSLGMEFFSSTTHSYCINSNSEFNAVLSESAQLSDGSFVMLPSTEISGAELGPQSGSDTADLLCALGFGDHDVHHMGGHNLARRRPGGNSDFLAFCDNPMSGQRNNVDTVNAEGGFTLVNHPNSGAWAFNSVAELRGQERNGTWGVEVWNGSEGANSWQNYQRDWWLSRLNEGKVLYPYSGSDTHDTAVNFGATHTYVPGSLTPQSITDALKEGRSYLSNGPFLELGIETVNGARSLSMGGKAIVPNIPRNIQININVDYNCSTSSQITIYRGVVGGGETVIFSQTGYQGGGTLQIQDTVPTQSFWYRAEVHNVQYTLSALTTPVYVIEV